MKTFLLGLALAAGIGTGAQAASLIHDMTFDTSLEDSIGRAEIVGRGPLADGQYQASASHRLDLLGLAVGDSYSLVMEMTYTAFAQGFDANEIIGSEGRDGNEGVFVQDGRLTTFRDAARGRTADPLQIGKTPIALGRAFGLTLTIDQAANSMKGYVDGILQWETGILNVMRGTDDVTLFRNTLYPRDIPDFAVSVDRIRVFDAVLSQSDINAMTTPVPLPASVVLLLAGCGSLAGLGASRRRRRGA